MRPHVGGADAIVFAAGAGPGSGDARKRTMDLGGAVKCIEAAQELGVARFVIVSSMGTRRHRPTARCGRTWRPSATPTRRSTDSGLDWTIVRPGRADRTSRARAPSTLAPRLGRCGEIPRDDVALVLYALPVGATTPSAARSTCSSGPDSVEAGGRSLTTR